MPYGQAVQRNQDWFALADQLAQIDKLCSDSIQRDIQQRTKDVEADLTTLHARIKEDPDTYKVSVPTIKSLAEVTRLVAKEIEQFAILRMRIKELATCLTANRNKLEKIIA